MLSGFIRENSGSLAAARKAGLTRPPSRVLLCVLGSGDHPHFEIPKSCL